MDKISVSIVDDTPAAMTPDAVAAKSLVIGASASPNSIQSQENPCPSPESTPTTSGPLIPGARPSGPANPFGNTLNIVATDSIHPNAGFDWIPSVVLTHFKISRSMKPRNCWLNNILQDHKFQSGHQYCSISGNSHESAK